VGNLSKTEHSRLEFNIDGGRTTFSFQRQESCVKRRKKEEGRRKKEEGRRKKEEGFLPNLT
jgi:hypothetical protein